MSNFEGTKAQRGQRHKGIISLERAGLICYNKIDCRIESQRNDKDKTISNNIKHPEVEGD
jgi:hypothetical protein